MNEHLPTCRSRDGVSSCDCRSSARSGQEDSVTGNSADPLAEYVTKIESRPVGRPRKCYGYEGVEGTCHFCGESLPATRGGRKLRVGAKFCSGACRQAAYRERRAA
jgi:hypothetical protein